MLPVFQMKKYGIKALDGNVLRLGRQITAKYPYVRTMWAGPFMCRLAVTHPEYSKLWLKSSGRLAHSDDGVLDQLYIKDMHKASSQYPETTRNLHIEFCERTHFKSACGKKK